jgi:hypothetical protein
LPPNIRTYPAGHAGPLTNYRKWVRKETFLEALDQITHQSKLH